MLRSLMDMLIKAGRWLVWSPLRLLAALVVVGLVLGVVVQVQKLTTPPDPSAPSSVRQERLPPDWETWPKTTATPQPAPRKTVPTPEEGGE